MEQSVTELANVDLDDKYTRPHGRIFLTGIQALVRIALVQRQRDRAAGHNTAGYISGYRGSPLGGFDQQLERARAHLDQHQVVFQPGVNEDLAATACWGTQQAELDGEGTHDGVFCIWYGKGPGVDRSGDALRHANLAGTSRLGGVLALLGDDHNCESSTTAHHSEYAMVDATIPVLNPAGVQEILDFGLYGIALSRYSGCWVALKCVHDTIEAAASVEIDPARLEVVIPDDPIVPPEGLGIRWPDTPQAQERRLYEQKIEAVRGFCRANRLDRMVWAPPTGKIGLATTGKPYLDTRQALEDLGIDEAAAYRLGIRLYKIAMPFPLEPDGARRFAAGLDTIIVVEEKRTLIEAQLKDILYMTSQAPRIVGKRDEADRPLFPSAGRLDSNHIAVEIGRRLLSRTDDTGLAERVATLAAILNRDASESAAIARTPYFCPGCPHNTSTQIPDGSRALAGIGCHYLAQFMDRSTDRYTHMGGEGASWIGQSRFSKRGHVFQNIGDGTYFHSGLLSIRAAIAAGTNVTFKILYNDAVAMTGGQPVDGHLTVPILTRQMAAEGARRIAVVTDEPEKYGARGDFAPDVTVQHRRELETVQRALREIAGTTIIIYDQTCAAEKRRRRKRGTFPDPSRRVLINAAVCEGCGDCGVRSNCIAVVPTNTEFGRKRAIDQSSCNKDFSCVDGFCPSFVTVHGAKLRRGTGASHSGAAVSALPEPSLPDLYRPYQVIITGIGGTGVITIGAVLGMAAHLESKGCSVLDQTGLAQKGGAVVSHIRIAPRPDDITTTRIAEGAADLVLGCDVVVTAGADTRATMRTGKSTVVVNTHEAMVGDFTRDPDLVFPTTALMNSIVQAAGARRVERIDATRLATALTGDAIATNMFMLGYAWQKGRIPLSKIALKRAIELNGVAVEMNLSALDWGRRAAVHPDEVRRSAGLNAGEPAPERESLESMVERRAAFLADYQDSAYADRYRGFVERIRAGERARTPGRRGLTEAVARSYCKLLAYKDEYEVARLYCAPEFRRQLETTFEGNYTLAFHLAPPLFARRDPITGVPRKAHYGGWMMRVFAALAPFKKLRGTVFDPFGYTRERRRERALIGRYEQVMASLLEALDHSNHALAIEIGSLPEQIRGFGHVKAGTITAAELRQAELLRRFKEPPAQPDAA